MRILPMMAAVVTTLATGTAAGATAAAPSRPPEGCAVTLQQQCAVAGNADAQAQCRAAHTDGLSDPCKAAMAQQPPAGIAKHLGTEPVPTATSQATANTMPFPMPIPARPASYPPEAAPAQPLPALPYIPPAVILATPQAEIIQK